MGRWRDLDGVRAFHHVGAQFAQFCGHGRNAVGFLHAPTGDVAQLRGALGIQGHHGQCHGGVGDVVAIEIDGLQGPVAAADVQPIGAAFNLRAHGPRGIDETDVALDGVRTDTQYLDAAGLPLASSYRPERNEVASARRVCLDMDGAGRTQRTAGRDGEALPAIALDVDAKACQQVERDFDVGFGDQLAHHVNADALRLCGQGQCHEQSGEELAGDITAHADGHVQLQRGRANVQWRVAFCSEVIDLATEQAQGIDQITNGAFMHARNAAEGVIATQYRQGGCQRTHRSAGIAQE